MNRKIITFLFFCSVLLLSANSSLARTCGPDWFCNDNQACGSRPMTCVDANNPPDPFPPGNDPKSDVNSCCRLKHNIRFEGITFPKGCVVGAHKDDRAAYCWINGNNITDEVITWKTETGGTDPCAASRPVAAYKKWGMVCLLNTIHSITNWIFYIMLVITIFLVTLAGYYQMTAMGDPEKASKARRIIWYSIIGLLLSLLAYFFPAMVMRAAG